MTTPEPTRPVAERLAEALGWEHPPQLTEAEEAEFHRRNAEADAEAERFYGHRAA